MYKLDAEDTNLLVSENPSLYYLRSYSLVRPKEDDEPECVGEADEEAGDGFFVDDGYLSEDEGVRQSQLDPAAADGDEDGIAGAAGAGRGSSSAPAAPSHGVLKGGSASQCVDPRLQLLQSACDRAARANRVLVLVRPGSGLACDQASGLDPQVRDQIDVLILMHAPLLIVVAGISSCVGLCHEQNRSILPSHSSSHAHSYLPLPPFSQILEALRPIILKPPNHKAAPLKGGLSLTSRDLGIYAGFAASLAASSAAPKAVGSGGAVGSLGQAAGEGGGLAGDGGPHPTVLAGTTRTLVAPPGRAEAGIRDISLGISIS